MSTIQACPLHAPRFAAAMDDSRPRPACPRGRFVVALIPFR